MESPETRRDFLKKGTVAAAGVVASTAVAGEANSAQEPTAPQPGAEGGPETRKAQVPPQQGIGQVPARPEGQPQQGKYDLPAEFKQYDRYYPTYGGPEDSDTFLGKLVPGLRASGLPPVPFVQPDVQRLPWKLVDGVKEFHLTIETVRRELLPGRWMDLLGANGSCPGPYVEVTQGDTVRMVVHNHLAEPTSVHWHGAELPNNMDGVPGVTQDLIEPGEDFVYQFRVHQAGTFFWHAHVPFQEPLGTVGFFIIHPKVGWDPPVDRDFGLNFMNFSIAPNQTVATVFPMHPGTMGANMWNWHIINGRAAPYTTPLVCKLGERVRIRIFNFSINWPHAIHMHGTNFWVTGHEGARQPSSSWRCRNTETIHIAQTSDLEFIATDPGDWVMHCHMAMHMVNHPVPQYGPRIREGVNVARYKANLEDRPPVELPHSDPGFLTPNFPRSRYAKDYTPEEAIKINSKRECRGMRHNWFSDIEGLFTIVRVLPEDLFDQVMHSDTPLEPGAIFSEVSRRRERQQKEREELRKRNLDVSQYQEWLDANEVRRRKGLV
jgi:FtsP/CotA-like multicopper oxidase with cupredoxin domain